MSSNTNWNPIKLKLYLSPEERQAYRLAANVVGKESISEYMAHAIQTYTAFLVKELRDQVAAASPSTSNVLDATPQEPEVPSNG
jgi:hypothetical protein